jgi:hydrogenase maturation protease
VSAPAPILVAGIGNVFCGDDGFGVEVVRRLFDRPPRADVKVVDFGIRGVHLAYALLDPWSAVILVDTVSRGGAPGTLYLIEPELTREAHRPMQMDAHRLDPVQVLATARQIRGDLPAVRLVGCEPMTFGDGEDLAQGLSAPVARAVDGALAMIDEVIAGMPGAADA